jgi:hypothetical protein
MSFQNEFNIALDSRLIYHIDAFYHLKVRWSRPGLKSDSEWIYSGLHEDFKKELVVESIMRHFRNDITLYLKLERKNSMSISRSDLISRLTGLIGKDIRIWDDKFEHVIEFNKVGVFRLGTITGL